MTLILPAAARARWRDEWLAELSMLATRRERLTFAAQTLPGIARLAATLYRWQPPRPAPRPIPGRASCSAWSGAGATRSYWPRTGSEPTAPGSPLLAVAPELSLPRDQLEQLAVLYASPDRPANVSVPTPQARGRGWSTLPGVMSRAELVVDNAVARGYEWSEPAGYRRLPEWTLWQSRRLIVGAPCRELRRSHADQHRLSGQLRKRAVPACDTTPLPSALTLTLPPPRTVLKSSATRTPRRTQTWLNVTHRGLPPAGLPTLAEPR